jgi:uncharacterized protein (UPF0216 family)
MILDNERVLERWLKIEFHNLNKNIVTRQVPIAELLKMEIPKTPTRTGEDYRFDTTSLQKLGSAIPKLIHSDLKLPIYFYKDLRVKDSCFITDQTAVKALRHTNDLDPKYGFRDDKLWLSRPIAHDIANKYPTLFQFVIY